MPNQLFSKLSYLQFAILACASSIGYTFSLDDLSKFLESDEAEIIKELDQLGTFVNIFRSERKEYSFISQEIYQNLLTYLHALEEDDEAGKVIFYYKTKETRYQNKFDKLLAQIKNHTDYLTQIIKNPYIQEGNWEQSLMLITETLSKVIDVTRVSVWSYNEAEGYIECLDLYENQHHKHSKGSVLYQKDFPSYFKALEDEVVINANNALTNEYTFEFAEVYLTPLEICSMLDIPFYIGGKLGGVICFEHQFNFRKWKVEEIMFTTSICSVISITYQSLLIKQNEKELKKANAEIISQNEELNQQQEELAAINESLVMKNALIEMQRTELKKQYEILDAQQKKLIDTTKRLNKSIEYAKSIQDTILPKPSEVLNFFTDYFSIYLPKDVVSGDFYWFYQVNTQKAFLVLADCTGHGVAGAFMSMIGNTLLYKIIKERGVHNPVQILAFLHEDIISLLRQKEEINKDGMDVSICLFEKLDAYTQVTFAGAKSIAFYTINGQINQLLGDRTHIGGVRQRESSFTNQTLALLPQSSFYLLSDGYIDQPNKDRKRFGTKSFQELLQAIKELPFREQEEKILESLYLHQGTEEQRDDISVIGLQL
jgi:serine phosphatase RsbU (regulator of sigma subunit)